jgi:hypothetical protein
MRFRQILTIFRGFLEDLPFGEHTKDADQKIRPCFRVSREFHRKKRAFLRKNAVFGKSGPTLPEKGENFLLQFFAFLKNSGNFSDFEFLKQPHYWTILKNTRKISICDFLRKNRDGQKKANFTFFKNAFFRKNAFCDFLLRRAYAKMKK